MHPKQLENIERFRDQSKRISDGDYLPDVIRRLKRLQPDLAGEMVLFNWIPDQGEDFYTLVCSNGFVYTIELPRDGETPDEVKVTPLSKWRKRRLGGVNRRNLEAIISLFAEAKSQ